MDEEIQTPPQESNPLDVSLWLSRLKQAEKVMKEDFKPKWDLARKRLRSELETKKQRKNLPAHQHVNLGYSIGSNFVNAVFFRAPECNLTARDEKQREQVENTEAKINEYLRDKRIKKTGKRVIWDAFSGGLGAVYVDWEYSDYETGEPVIDEASGQPIMGEDGQPLMKRVVVKNNPVIKRLRPDLIRFPKGFDLDEYQESPWIGFDMLIPVDDVKADESLDPNFREKIEGDIYSKALDKEATAQSKAEADVKYALLHYVFIKPTEPGGNFKMMVLCKETDTPGLMQEMEKGHVGYPIHFLAFNPLDDDCSYPPGDMWLMESQLEAVEEWWRRMVDHVKRTHPKWVYLKKHIAPTTLKELKGNRDVAWIGLEPKDPTPLDRLVSPLQHPPVHPDNHILLEASKGFLSEVGPQSAQSRGAQDKDIDTATEAQIVNQHEMIDMDGRVDVIKDFWIDVIVDLAGLYANNLVGVTQVQGMSKIGVPFSRTAGKQDFSTAFDRPDINVESMKHPNREVYRMQLERTMQTLAAFIEPKLRERGETIDFKFFINKWFDEMEIKNADQAIVPLNIRNPNKEHEDFIFGNTPDGQPLPMVVQPMENSIEHLKEHDLLAGDEIALATYEGLKPGFAQALEKHRMETQLKIQEEQKLNGKNDGQMPTGKMPAFATEKGKANNV